MDHFCKKLSFLKAKKILTLIFFAEKSKNRKKILHHRKVGIKIVKVKKFGVDKYIPHEMAAESAKGGFVRTPPQY